MEHQAEKGRILNVLFKEVEAGNLGSKHWCNNILKKIVKETKMTPISSPMCVVYHDDNDSSKDGVSGVIIIAESHVGIHCWLYGDIDLTINSCRDFNSKQIIEFCKEEFLTDNVKVNVDFKKG